MTNPDLPKLLDGSRFLSWPRRFYWRLILPVPKWLFKSRNLLNNFAGKLNTISVSQTHAWLTDTFDDKNGVSMVLQACIKRLNSATCLLIYWFAVQLATRRSFNCGKANFRIYTHFYPEQP
jgi:hypothetical protein